MTVSWPFLSSYQLNNEPDPAFALGNCLIYKVFVPSPSLIQVGTLLAPGYFEETKAMTDSHLPTSKRTIMMVDDNPDIVDILRNMLEENGFNVRCAYSGLELFASLKEQTSDLILLDIMMPQMDGLEVLRRLKGAPETSSIPIIMITVKDEDKLAAHKLGADDYITKPFDIDKLVTAINHLLSGDQGRSVESL